MFLITSLNRVIELTRFIWFKPNLFDCDQIYVIILDSIKILVYFSLKFNKKNERYSVTEPNCIRCFSWFSRVLKIQIVLKINKKQWSRRRNQELG